MATPYKSPIAAVLAACPLLLAGCGRSTEPPAAAGTPPASQAQPADALPPEMDRDAELAAKQEELARRETELALKERELNIARREAELAKQEVSRTAARTRQGAAGAAARPAPSSPSSTPVAPVAVKQPVLVAVTVPSGTQLTVALSGDLSTKTAQQGDPFEARVVSDVVVNGKRAVPAQSRVMGTVTDVISGSNKIGGVPTLGLRFDSLLLDDGQRLAINGELVEQGKSDTGRDAAKILGGAAAGAILGHQVKSNDGGKIIGGLLGGAIGAVAARKTGTEVQLAAGSQLTIALGSSFEVVPH